MILLFIKLNLDALHAPSSMMAIEASLFYVSHSGLTVHFFKN